jgi:hypothetical protein
MEFSVVTVFNGKTEIRGIACGIGAGPNKGMRAIVVDGVDTIEWYPTNYFTPCRNADGTPMVIRVPHAKSMA